LLLATTYVPGRRPGTEATWWSTSVRLNGTSQEIQAVVLSARWAWNGSAAPEPSRPVCRSATPATTGTASGSPSSAATAGSTGPSRLPVGSRSGRRAGSRVERRTRSGT